MPEKAVKNYYMFINQLAIDVCRIKGTSYIKVVDRETGNKRLMFTMDLKLVSDNVDMVVVDKVKSVLQRNLTLLKARERKLM